MYAQHDVNRIILCSTHANITADHAGLNVKIFIERNEYLKGFTSGNGVRVVVHPFDTQPFVSESGVSLSTGTANYMGMRMVSRLNIQFIGGC